MYLDESRSFVGQYRWRKRLKRSTVAGSTAVGSMVVGSIMVDSTVVGMMA